MICSLLCAFSSSCRDFIRIRSLLSQSVRLLFRMSRYQPLDTRDSLPCNPRDCRRSCRQSMQRGDYFWPALVSSLGELCCLRFFSRERMNYRYFLPRSISAARSSDSLAVECCIWLAMDSRSCSDTLGLNSCLIISLYRFFLSTWSKSVSYPSSPPLNFFCSSRQNFDLNDTSIVLLAMTILDCRPDLYSRQLCQCSLIYQSVGFCFCLYLYYSSFFLFYYSMGSQTFYLYCYYMRMCRGLVVLQVLRNWLNFSCCSLRQVCARCFYSMVLETYYLYFSFFSFSRLRLIYSSICSFSRLRCSSFRFSCSILSLNLRSSSLISLILACVSLVLGWSCLKYSLSQIGTSWTHNPNSSTPTLLSPLSALSPLPPTSPHISSNFSSTILPILAFMTSLTCT